MTAKELYDRDFLEWTRCNAALLRAGRFLEADIEHIAEEVEDMGRSQQHELRSRLRVLLVHLLKWRFQPSHRGPSWRATIRDQRDEIADLIETAPSLRNEAARVIEKTYRRAAARAAEETSLPETTFPEKCPFTVEQILDEDYLPDETP